MKDEFIKVQAELIQYKNKGKKTVGKAVVEKKFCPKCNVDSEIVAWWFVNGRIIYALSCKHRISEKVEVKGIINDPCYYLSWR